MFAKYNLQNTLLKYLFLHILIFIYSFSGIFAKYASNYNPFTFMFWLFYGLMIFILFIYAVGWQIILKYMPISTAFMNKAVTIIWGLVFGVILFDEAVTLKKIIGIAFIFVGVYFYCKSDEKDRACQTTN